MWMFRKMTEREEQEKIRPTHPFAEGARGPFRDSGGENAEKTQAERSEEWGSLYWA